MPIVVCNPDTVLFQTAGCMQYFQPAPDLSTSSRIAAELTSEGRGPPLPAAPILRTY